MLVFGVDVPLVELILAFSVISFLILLEVIVILILVMYQYKRSKKKK